MPPVDRLNKTPRCGAKTRSGHPCRQPAVRGKRRCRMHGGTNPGAPKGNRNAWKHGHWGAEAIAFRCAMRLLIRNGHKLIDEI